jgi:hypothetical protein
MMKLRSIALALAFFVSLGSTSYAQLSAKGGGPSMQPHGSHGRRSHARARHTHGIHP